ncbi:MAG: hypothetical protein IJ362_03695 [Oscillospiraceae bacterium]|nr:hypothetical protein [Oscillospiraceae bacterium]
MKKIFSIILSMALCFSLAACGGSAGEGGSAAAKDLVYPAAVTNRPMVVNDVYDYKTICYTDRSLETNGHIYIYDYIVEPAGDGMVDKTVKAMFIFDDDNAWNNGMSFDVLYMDFPEDEYTGGAENWTVDVDGTEYPVEVLQDEFISGGWTPMSNFVSKYVLTIRMPENYDDVALFFYNTRNKLAVAGEDAPIPDGTPIDKLLDADSQWFILGGKGDDWDTTKTPTYYGAPVEAQINNTDIRDVLGGDPVFDVPDDVEDGAPPADMMENFPRIEIVDWSENVLKRNGITEVKIDFDIYNAPEGSYFEATAYTDAPKATVEKDSAYSESGVLRWSVILEVDGREATTESASFEIGVYDADGALIDISKFDIPFDEPADTQSAPADDNPPDDGDVWIEIPEITADTVEKSVEYQAVNFFYEIHGYRDDLSLYCYTYNESDPDTELQVLEFTPGESGSLSMDVFGAELEGDWLVVVFELLDYDGFVLSTSEVRLMIK